MAGAVVPEQVYTSLDGTEVTLTYPEGWTPPGALNLGPPEGEVWPCFLPAALVATE